MSPRKSAAALTLGGSRVRQDAPPDQTGTLTWHHTEFGRRTDCLRYHVVRKGDGWQLLDQPTWDPIGPPVPTIDQAMYTAERHAAKALPRGTARHTSAPGGD